MWTKIVDILERQEGKQLLRGETRFIVDCV